MHILQRKPRCHRSAQRPLAVDVIGFESRKVGLHDEAANFVFLIFQLGPDNGDIGNGSGSDPHLLAIEHVAIANFFAARADAAGIGAEARLGQSEAADFFPFLQRRQPLLFLLVAAEGVNGIHH